VLQWQDAVLLDFPRTAEGAWGMDRQIDVIAANPVDCARHDAGHRMHLDVLAATAEVPENEWEPNPLDDARRRLGLRIQRMLDVAVGKYYCSNGIEGKDTLAARCRASQEVCGHPVATECSWADKDGVTAEEDDPEDCAKIRAAPTGQAHEAVADRKPAQPEPLLFRTKVTRLGVQLVFELALKVVKKFVPTHKAEVTAGREPVPRLSTGHISPRPEQHSPD